MATGGTGIYEDSDGWINHQFSNSYGPECIDPERQLNYANTIIENLEWNFSPDR